MNTIYIPDGYKPLLDAYDTQRAIAYIKQTFQDEFSAALNLKRVSAPLFVTAQSGLNDNLSGKEKNRLTEAILRVFGDRVKLYR